jgi:hypothetical protein
LNARVPHGEECAQRTAPLYEGERVAQMRAARSLLLHRQMQ